MIISMALSHRNQCPCMEGMSGVSLEIALMRHEPMNQSLHTAHHILAATRVNGTVKRCHRYFGISKARQRSRRYDRGHPTYWAWLCTNRHSVVLRSGLSIGNRIHFFAPPPILKLFLNSKLNNTVTAAAQQGMRLG